MQKNDTISHTFARPDIRTTDIAASLVRSVPPLRGDERGRTSGQAASTTGTVVESSAAEPLTDEFGNPLLHVAKKRRKSKPEVPLERQDQAEVLKELRYRGLTFQTGLEGLHLNENQRRAAKHAGMASGNPDISISDPAPGCPEARRIHIEMKRQKPFGKAPSPEQLERHKRLRRQGEVVFVCYGAEEAFAVIEAMWGPRPPEAVKECSDCGLRGPKSQIRQCFTCPRRVCAGCRRGERQCGRCA